MTRAVCEGGTRGPGGSLQSDAALTEATPAPSAQPDWTPALQALELAVDRARSGPSHCHGPTRGGERAMVDVAIDDGTWLGFAEVLPYERQEAIAGFLERSRRHFGRCGIHIPRLTTATVRHTARAPSVPSSPRTSCATCARAAHEPPGGTRHPRSAEQVAVRPSLPHEPRSNQCPSPFSRALQHRPALHRRPRPAPHQKLAPCERRIDHLHPGTRPHQCDRSAIQLITSPLYNADPAPTGESAAHVNWVQRIACGFESGSSSRNFSGHESPPEVLPIINAPLRKGGPSTGTCHTARHSRPRRRPGPRPRN